MYDKIYDVCIIGAGASGLVAAIESSRRGLSCVVVDKNKKPGMKLYSTGNGRCNLTNDKWEEDDYYGNIFADMVFGSLYKKTGKHPRAFILEYFKHLGINTISKDGYIYPSSMQASSVVWALLDAARLGGVEIVSKFTVEHLALYNSSNNQIFDESYDSYSHSYGYDARIYAADNYNTESIYLIKGLKSVDDTIQEATVFARNVILATGGLSQTKLGSASKEGLEKLLMDTRVPYRDFVSCLCPVETEENLTALDGVRSKIRMTVNGKSENGELQINKKGLSGIVTFNMSYYMNPGTEVFINLLPSVNEESFVEHFEIIRMLYPDKTLLAFLNGYINDKLALYMINKFFGFIASPDGKKPEFKLSEVTDIGIRGIFEEMTNWRLIVQNRVGFDSSQASDGGIIMGVIDSDTMHIDVSSSLGSNLYAVGEVTDVIGKCGGYNLTYAFVTGYLAGNAIPSFDNSPMTQNTLF